MRWRRSSTSPGGTAAGLGLRGRGLFRIAAEDDFILAQVARLRRRRARIQQQRVRAHFTAGLFDGVLNGAGEIRLHMKLLMFACGCHGY